MSSPDLSSISLASSMLLPCSLTTIGNSRPGGIQMIKLRRSSKNPNFSYGYRTVQIMATCFVTSSYDSVGNNPAVHDTTKDVNQNSFNLGREGEFNAKPGSVI